MPRYIDADKIVYWTRYVSSNCLQSDVRKVAFRDEIERMPTADVVPRSEVAKIFEELDEARERWESTYSSDHFGYGGGSYGYLQTDVDHTIYELKRKYTEENNNEN